MKRSIRNAGIISLAALAGGGVAYAVPLSLFETLVSTTGISETLPAFAPPLGDKAQTLIVGASAIFSGFLTAIILPWKDESIHPIGKDEGMAMGMLLSRLTSFARNLRSSSDGDDRDDVTPPQLRRSDSHPDAPSRAPLFARRELGEEMLPPVTGAANDPAIGVAVKEDSDSIAARRLARIRGEHVAPMIAGQPLSPSAPEKILADADATGELAIEPVGELELGVEAAIAQESAETSVSHAAETRPLMNGIQVDERKDGEGMPLSFSPASHVEEGVNDDIAMPRAPEPLPWHLIEEEMSRIMNGGSVVSAATGPVVDDPAVVSEEKPELSLVDLPVAEVDAAGVDEVAEQITSSPEKKPEVIAATAPSVIYDAPEFVAPVPAFNEVSLNQAPQQALVAEAAISHLVERLEKGLARRKSRLGSKVTDGPAQPVTASQEKGEETQAPTSVAFGFSMPNMSVVADGDKDVSTAGYLNTDDNGGDYRAYASACQPAQVNGGGQGDDLQRALAALRATITDRAPR